MENGFQELQIMHIPYMGRMKSYELLKGNGRTEWRTDERAEGNPISPYATLLRRRTKRVWRGHWYCISITEYLFPVSVRGTQVQLDTSKTLHRRWETVLHASHPSQSKSFTQNKYYVAHPSVINTTNMETRAYGLSVQTCISILRLLCWLLFIDQIRLKYFTFFFWPYVTKNHCQSDEKIR